MMFTGYLNQTAVYQERSGVDTYGDPTLGSEETVKCRKEKEYQLVQSTTGEIYETVYTYFLPFQPIEGSTLDGLEIKGVSDNPGLDGVTTVWEAYC